MESIIPTPSIDQVLQSLASNALSSTSAQDSEEDQPGGREEIVNLDSSDDSESEKGNAATKNNKIVLNHVSRPNKRKLPLVTDQARLNVIMDKNRSAYLREKFQLHQKNNSRTIYRINHSKNRILQKPYQPPISNTSTFSSNYAPKTVSEMLNDLVNMSVDKTLENSASLKEQSSNNNSNNLRFVPATPEESSLFVAAPPQLEPQEHQSQANSSDDDIQVISDNNNNVDDCEMQDNLQDDSEIVGNDAGLDATPFCKNCASEVPLIIKRLDRLDGMVDKMIKLVKNSLSNPAISRGFEENFYYEKSLSIRNASTEHLLVPDKSLRRLPIPKLENSCKRYLDAVKAIYSENEIKEMEGLIDNFMKNEGPELHKALIDYDRQHLDTSYISEPWFDMYLSARVPLPVNYNPFMMFAPDPDPRYNDQ
uniref:Choline/carnitine acyltransferase domain-containing protein n=1 Tax=Meloidogyne javanica TaxID=6303 RepID=A0A915LML8_MELJA